MANFRHRLLRIIPQLIKRCVLTTILYEYRLADHDFSIHESYFSGPVVARRFVRTLNVEPFRSWSLREGRKQPRRSTQVQAGLSVKIRKNYFFSSAFDFSAVFSFARSAFMASPFGESVLAVSLFLDSELLVDFPESEALLLAPFSAG